MGKTVLLRQCGIAILLVLLAVFTGCTHYYVPRQYPLKPEMIPEFSGKGAVTVVNGYAGPKVMVLAAQGGDTWKGDMQKWTDTAVGLLTSELQKRGFHVTQGAPKELKLVVTHANMYWGFASYRCILYLRVETGHGYTHEYEGNNASGWTVYRASDGAVTRAIAAMLKDEKIRAYLKSDSA
ncbi:MAG: hypothetical protein GY849_14540 [Deltaproteobacteria bacterium]|nr:hypothetical protein [Deltaproteobacteria bacterium]